MGLFRRKQKTSAEQAKERLQLLLTHERSGRGMPDFLPRLQEDLLEVIDRYVAIERDSVSMHVEDMGEIFTLEINVEIPPAAVVTKAEGEVSPAPA